MTRSQANSARVITRLNNAFPDLNIIRVRDASSPIEVEVLSGDAKRGKSFKNKECALARACKRQLNVSGVVINLSTSYLVRRIKDTNNYEALRYHTSTTAQREILSYDRHHDFSPGIYRLGAFSKSATLPAVRAYKKTGSRTPKGIVHRHRTINVRKAI